MHASTPDAPSRLELIFAILTGIGHVTLEVACGGLQGAAESLNRPQHVYNLGALVVWGLYLLWRGCTTPGLAAAWGFRKAGFARGLRESLLFAGIALVPLVAIGAAAGHLPLPATFWLVLGLYPLWGLAQQFVLQALVTRNLRDIIPHASWRAAAASVLFGAAHFPNTWLMTLTFAAGFGFTWSYERHRNIWAVGLCHGVLGAAAYYLVLGLDPGAELIRLLGR